MRRHVFQLIVIALIALGLAIPAGAHGESYVNYDCGGQWAIEHHTPGSWHRGAGVPGGTTGNGCDYYKAKVTVTSWSGGGSSGWYTYPNHTVEILWQTNWIYNFADDNYYCYFVRAGGKGKKGGTDYGWRFYYHGYQPSCWYG